MTANFAEPAEAFRAFLNEMYKWELDSRQRSKRIEKGELDGEESHRESREALRDIFQRFCVVGDYSVRGIRYQHPPEYNPETEKIVSITQATPDSAEILTEQSAGWKHRRKFTLRKVDGSWRMAAKYRINSNGEEIEESL